MCGVFLSHIQSLSSDYPCQTPKYFTGFGRGAAPGEQEGQYAFVF